MSALREIFSRRNLQAGAWNALHPRQLGNMNPPYMQQGYSMWPGIASRIANNPVSNFFYGAADRQNNFRQKNLEQDPSYQRWLQQQMMKGPTTGGYNPGGSAPGFQPTPIRSQRQRPLDQYQQMTPMPYYQRPTQRPR